MVRKRHFSPPPHFMHKWSFCQDSPGTNIEGNLIGKRRPFLQAPGPGLLQCGATDADRWLLDRTGPSDRGQWLHARAAGRPSSARCCCRCCCPSCGKGGGGRAGAAAAVIRRRTKRASSAAAVRAAAVSALPAARLADLRQRRRGLPQRRCHGRAPFTGLCSVLPR